MLGVKGGPSQKDIHRHSKESSGSGLVHTHFPHPLPDPLFLLVAVMQYPPCPSQPAPALACSRLHSGPHSPDQALRPWAALNHSTSAIVDSRNPLPLALQTCPPSCTPVYLICSGLSPFQALLAPAQRGPCPPQLVPPTLRLSLPSIPSDTGLPLQAVRQGHVSLTSGLLFSPLSTSASILQARRPEGPSTPTQAGTLPVN